MSFMDFVEIVGYVLFVGVAYSFHLVGMGYMEEKHRKLDAEIEAMNTRITGK